MRNIFVSEADPSHITAIIDWQSTAVEPAFIYANETPGFVNRQVEDEDEEDDEIETSDHSTRLSSPAKDERAKHNQDILLCREAFGVCMQGYAPIIAKARNVDGVLLRPFRHCNKSWRDSAPAVRQELIEVSARWDSLGLDDVCPYVPIKAELERYQNQYADFEIAQSLELGLMQSLHTDSDGWVPSCDWEIVKPAHDAMFQEWLITAEDDEEMNEAKARGLWPFDQV
jgi:hypothetical protein